MSVQDIAVVYLRRVKFFCYSRQHDVNSLLTCYNTYILITICLILCLVLDFLVQTFDTAGYNAVTVVDTLDHLFEICIA